MCSQCHKSFITYQKYLLSSQKEFHGKFNKGHLHNDNELGTLLLQEISQRIG